MRCCAPPCASLRRDSGLGRRDADYPIQWNRSRDHLLRQEKERIGSEKRGEQRALGVRDMAIRLVKFVEEGGRSFALEEVRNLGFEVELE